MADGTTNSYSFTLPEVGASQDTWGTKLNQNWTKTDQLLDGTTPIAPNLTEGSWKVGGTAITATAAEINYVDGVTSPIQTQINTITADDWVTASRIADGAVGTAQIANDAVTTAKIAASAVGSTEIANDAVTSAKIADSVTLGGSPTTTTQAVSNRSTRIATTDFVRDAIEAYAEVVLPSAAAQASAASDSITVTYGPTGKALVLAAAGRKAIFGNHGTVSYTLKRGSTTVRSESGQVIEYDNRDSDSTFVLFYTQTGKTAGSTETWTVASSGAGSATYATIAYIGF